jgi:hypothetical protein
VLVGKDWPSIHGLDDDIDVMVRDRHANTLYSKKLCYETQRQFCLEGQRDGEYQIVFVLHKRGVAQPTVVFPTDFKKTRNKLCDSIYMVEPNCPK